MHTIGLPNTAIGAHDKRYTAGNWMDNKMNVTEYTVDIDID